MESLFIHYLTAWEPLGYILVFIGMMFEGDTVLFAAVFLAHQGYLSLFPVFLASLWGMILGDNLWYTLGVKMRFGQKFPVLAKWAESLAQPFDDHLRQKPFRTIFLAKFTYGFNRAIITRAGMLNLKWKKLEESDILATLLWMAIVGVIAYFSSASLSYLKDYLKYGEVALFIGIVFFIILQKIVSDQSKKRL